jgi:hypothetical protein
MVALSDKLSHPTLGWLKVSDDVAVGQTDGGLGLAPLYVWFVIFL